MTVKYYKDEWCFKCNKKTHFYGDECLACNPEADYEVKYIEKKEVDEELNFKNLDEYLSKAGYTLFSRLESDKELLQNKLDELLSNPPKMKKEEKFSHSAPTPIEEEPEIIKHEKIGYMLKLFQKSFYALKIGEDNYKFTLEAELSSEQLSVLLLMLNRKESKDD